MRSMAEFICNDFLKEMSFPVIICGEEECKLIKCNGRGGKIKHCRSKKNRRSCVSEALREVVSARSICIHAREYNNGGL